ncbi:MAG: T9SS type A sorting domain-containing protein [Bacteroidota bacterium]
MCTISLTQYAFAQIGGVELVFPNNNPVNLTAGDQFCFQLAAKDAAGNVIIDWNSSGIDVTIFVTHTIVDTDTLLKSYNRHPDGYTWSKLTIGGQTIFPTTPHHFSIPKTLFTNGLADACYQASAAENDVRITVTPTFANLNQISPPINYTPAALDNFLVELTNQAPGPLWHDVYAHRPFEFIVVPRDRFLNHISALIPLRIESGFPAELDTVSGPFTTPPSTMAVDPFDPTLTIIGRQNFFLRTTAERLPAQNIAQWIRAYATLDPTIEGISDPFFALPHAPKDFTLLAPADQTQLTLTSPNSWESFTWEKPVPADAFTDVQISRFNGVVCTDSTHYTIHFTDVNRTQDIAFDSFDAGQLPTFGIRQSDLAAVIDQLSGTPHVPSFDIIWYVEATDGDYTTLSTPVGPGIRGHRLMITNTMFTGKGVGVNFTVHYPAGLPPGVTVNFELLAMENGSIINEWDGTGTDVTLMVKGTTVESDTSTRSWNADPNAYSWATLTANQQEIQPSAPHEYLIPHSLFIDGKAIIEYITTKADTGVTFEIEPTVAGITQTSPALSWTADTLENFLVEITWPDSATPGVYAQRPFELILTPRDRFLNTVDAETEIAVQARFPGELSCIDSTESNPFISSNATINGLQSYILLPRDAREPNQGMGQSITFFTPGKARIIGSTGEFPVLPHAPNEFSLISPTDMKEIKLRLSTDTEEFTWDRPDPVDPYTDILLSRFSPERFSDDVRYRVYFVDAGSLTRAVEFTSDDDGKLPLLTITHAELSAVIDQISGLPTTKKQDVVWYVKASDELYETTSKTTTTTLGNQLILTKEGTNGVDDALPSSLNLAQNYPNPFNPSTTISFTTTKRGEVSLKVFDLLGSEVATIQNGTLDAGEHSIMFDASKLRSGVYMYRLQAEGKSLSRRMVVMK